MLIESQQIPKYANIHNEDLYAVQALPIEVAD